MGLSFPSPSSPSSSSPVRSMGAAFTAVDSCDGRPLLPPSSSATPLSTRRWGSLAMAAAAL